MIKRILPVFLLLWSVQSAASYLLDGTNDRLTSASVPVTTYPHTVAGWVKVSGLGVSDIFLCLSPASADPDNSFRYSVSAADAFVFNAFVTTGIAATTTATISSTSTWYHYMAVATSATDRTVYLNGSNAGTSSTSRDPAGIAYMRFGELCDGSLDYAGRLGHWAVWDIALDATDAANLAGGDNPMAVEVADLVAYWPMTADAVDAVGSFDLTPENNAAIDGDNPTVDAPPGGVTFSVSPTVTATTATSYTLGYTVSGATTVYFVACNPGESAPDAAEVEAGDCGSGADAEAAANEAVSGADTTVISSIKMPYHDIYAIPESGGSVVTLADEDRAEDTNQDFVTLASVSATSFFALSTDSTGDTTDTSFVIAGMADTSDFAVGMLVDVSAGFADLTDLLVTGITSTSLTLEIASNATTSNITVTSNVYFNPTVAAGDVVEADVYANPVSSDGFHTGSGNAATLTDSTAAYTTNALINSRISNDTDGSACTITANTATTVTCTLTGGTQNDWDVDDAYTILPLITWETDGDFSYTAFSGGVLTTIGYCIQDVSDATGEFTVPACWTTDDVIYLFNTAPNFDDMGAFDDILIFDVDVALSGVDLANYCTDVDSQTMAFAYTGTPETGVTFNSDGTVTGTSTVENESGAAMSVLCGDPGELYARQTFTQYSIDTYTATDCTGGVTVAECAVLWDADHPWYGSSLDYMMATFEYSDLVAAGDIISQTPTEATEVDNPLQTIDLVVSAGPEPEPGKGGGAVGIQGTSMNPGLYKLPN